MSEHSSRGGLPRWNSTATSGTLEIEACRLLAFTISGEYWPQSDWPRGGQGPGSPPRGPGGARHRVAPRQTSPPRARPNGDSRRLDACSTSVFRQAAGRGSDRLAQRHRRAAIGCYSCAAVCRSGRSSLTPPNASRGWSRPWTSSPMKSGLSGAKWCPRGRQSARDSACAAVSASPGLASKSPGQHAQARATIRVRYRCAFTGGRTVESRRRIGQSGVMSPESESAIGAV